MRTTLRSEGTWSGRSRASAPLAEGGTPGGSAASRPARRLPVIEIFGPTLQGEGRLIGCKTMFVRFAGCDYGCSWCDTRYAWDPAQRAPVEPLAPAAVLARLQAGSQGCRSVTLSGGNPALHDLEPLLVRLRAAGWRVHMESQGSLARTWFGLLHAATFSPKGPSSGMPTDWAILARCLDLCGDPDLKVVVFDEADLAYALEVRRRFPEVPLTLQVGNRVGADDAAALLGRLGWLAARALAEPRLAEVRVLPQLHVQLWGNRRGV